ncbi:MAG: 50S ribosomal protein L30 [Desulfurococcaceae archaeon]
MAIYAIIRIRGQVNCPYDVEHTLRLLRLLKKYHCILYPSDLPGLSGMLYKTRAWITWGEIDRDTLIRLLYARGRLIGDLKLTDELVDKYLSKYNIKGGVPGLADAILEGKVMLHKLDNVIKPVFRLHPPKGGFKGTVKKPFNLGGEYGYRGSLINDLIKRMI